jgi:alkylhydroperoxidase family enzyme
MCRKKPFHHLRLRFDIRRAIPQIDHAVQEVQRLLSARHEQCADCVALHFGKIDANRGRRLDPLADQLVDALRELVPFLRAGRRYALDLALVLNADEYRAIAGIGKSDSGNSERQRDEMGEPADGG